MENGAGESRLRIALAVLALALTLPGLAQAQNEPWTPPDACWNGRQPSKYVKDTRLWRTLTTTPAGTTLTTRNPRVGRSGSTEWATAVSMPIDDNLANRELVAADVKVSFKSISGAPAVNVVSYWYTGYQWNGRKGSIETAPVADLLLALKTPHWVYGGDVFTTRTARTMSADNLASNADQIAWDEGLNWLSFFIAPAGPGYGDLKQVTLTIYTCPIEDFSRRASRKVVAGGARRNVAVVDELDELDDTPEVSLGEFYRTLLSWFDQNPQR